MCKKFIYVSIIGRTNVGKSTLFNQLINKKISITSKKKHTTNKYILGFYTKKKKQYVYIDSPGYKNYNNFKKNFHNINYFLKNNFKINRKINLIILILEKNFLFFEKKIIKKINIQNIPIIILINKIDKIKNKNIILPIIKNIINKKTYNHIIPISIKKHSSIKKIKKIINTFLINSKHYFDKNNKILYNEEFIISEIIREKILRLTGDEVPYNIYIKYIKINNLKNKKLIYCLIKTKKKKYIPILIGKKGKKIKNIIYLSIKNIKKFYYYKKKIKLFLKIK